VKTKLSPDCSPMKTSVKCLVSPPLPLSSKLSPSDLGETGAVVSPPHPLRGGGGEGKPAAFPVISGGKPQGDSFPGRGGETTRGTASLCPRRQRWAQVTCPLDRSPRSLGGMWLAYYLDQGATLDDARGLARSTCLALYPEVFPS